MQHYKQESARLRQQITNLQNSNRFSFYTKLSCASWSVNKTERSFDEFISPRCFRALIGDSITTMSHKDLKHLETRLDKGLGKIRARKVLCTIYIIIIFIALCVEKEIFCLHN